MRSWCGLIWLLSVAVKRLLWKKLLTMLTNRCKRPWRAIVWVSLKLCKLSLCKQLIKNNNDKHKTHKHIFISNSNTHFPTHPWLVTLFTITKWYRLPHFPINCWIPLVTHAKCRPIQVDSAIHRRRMCSIFKIWDFTLQMATCTF